MSESETLRNILMGRRAAMHGDDDDESDDDHVAPVLQRVPTPPPPRIADPLENYKADYRDHKKLGSDANPATTMAAFKNDAMLSRIFTAEQLQELEGTLCLGNLQQRSDDWLEISVQVWQGDALNFRVGFAQGYMDVNVKCAKNPAKAGNVIVTEIHRHRTEVTSRDRAPPNFFLPLVAEQVIAAARLKPPAPVTSDSIRDERSGGFGYNVWPKMGFNAEVPVRIVEKMINLTQQNEYTAALKGKQDVAAAFLQQHRNDLELADMFLQEGDLYDQLCILWKECGETISTVFDTSKEDSKSFKVLAKYAEMKNPLPVAGGGNVSASGAAPAKPVSES